ncbi:unnamed protein product [Trichobilharzia regenti]|nr:unnamed protein product [Trichobilharzia regenti]
MITTQSRLQFDYFIERLQCTDVDAYNYVMNRWMPMKSNWAVSFYSDDVITLGVNVIDIIKSVNPSIKESLKNLTDIKDCLTVLHNEAEKHWISPNRINLPLTHLTKNEESNDNNNNKIVIPEKLKSIFNQLTDYAADMMYNHSIRMNEIHVDFINSGIALCKDGYFQYEVNRNESTCSCAFNVSSFLPCEHLCLIYLRYGLYKDLLLNSKRWLKSYNIDLMKPSGVVISQPATTTTTTPTSLTTKQQPSSSSSLLLLSSDKEAITDITERLLSFQCE